MDELTNLVETYQKYLSEFAEHASKIDKIAQAKNNPEEIYNNPKHINYQEIKEANLLGLNDVEKISSQIDMHSSLNYSH